MTLTLEETQRRVWEDLDTAVAQFAELHDRFPLSATTMLVMLKESLKDLVGETDECVTSTTKPS